MSTSSLANSSVPVNPLSSIDEGLLLVLYLDIDVCRLEIDDRSREYYDSFVERGLAELRATPTGPFYNLTATGRQIMAERDAQWDAWIERAKRYDERIALSRTSTSTNTEAGDVE